ncbi:MAG: dNTP triphosphohydrolase [Clostridiales bacterium]|nr:dNTP triphosphohydrolase [Clostridiales bacterium]
MDDHEKMNNISFEQFEDLFSQIRGAVSVSDENRDRIRLAAANQDAMRSEFATPDCIDHRRAVPEEDCAVRTAFQRDLGRIIYSQSFRRLKHKTQVFFNPVNDHICSRLEHVIYVNYISQVIGGALNLNKDLIQAIALGHDIGHTPFGHSGERALSKKLKEKDSRLFFEHEAHSLRVLDVLEKHNDDYGLNLTFEVRDGILSHCGEAYDEYEIKPVRDKTEEELTYLKPKRSRRGPATLEGCVVKMADKIAYVGRDVEDALRMGIVNEDYFVSGEGKYLGTSNSEMINSLVEDVIENSFNRDEIRLSKKTGEALSRVLDRNLNEIYKATKITTYEEYADLIINSLFDTFMNALENRTYDTEPANEMIRKFFRFVDSHPQRNDGEDKMPLPIYVSDYIAGMTDGFAIQCFDSLFREC